MQPFKNPLVIIAILLFLLVVVIAVCCFMNKDKFRTKLKKGKPARKARTLTAGADPPAVKCASVPKVAARSSNATCVLTPKPHPTA